MGTKYYNEFTEEGRNRLRRDKLKSFINRSISKKIGKTHSNLNKMYYAIEELG